MSKQYSDVLGFFGGVGGEHAQKPKFGVKKQLQKAPRSVQFLMSFISF